MRNIILLLLFPVFLSAQSVVLKDSFPTYQGVINFDNKSIAEIHTLLMKTNTIILSSLRLDEKDKIMVTADKNYSYTQKEITDVRAGLVSMFGLLKEKPKDIVSAPIMVEVIKFKNGLIESLGSVPKDNW